MKTASTVASQRTASFNCLFSGPHVLHGILNFLYIYDNRMDSICMYVIRIIIKGGSVIAEHTVGCLNFPQVLFFLRMFWQGGPF